MREVGRFRNNPLRSKLPVRGYSKLEFHGMKELGLAESPAVEPSVAFHLHPNRRTMSASRELLEETGQQLDCGSPNLVLWEEICVVNDLSLHSTRGAVQGCGHVMGLAVAGEGVAFSLCLPRKQPPRPAQPQRAGPSGKAGPRAPQRGAPQHPGQHSGLQQRSRNPRAWGKHSYAAVAAKNRSSQLVESKKKCSS
uniref:Uncharacterized protein n=1 Tax=Knipowitschia caucasica TaxID=637954 RepID=A0AAV2K249_KNICA